LEARTDNRLSASIFPRNLEYRTDPYTNSSDFLYCITLCALKGATGTAAGNADFSVVISASGRADVRVNPSGAVESHLVHAVSVTQPVQSWTVIRDQVDFAALGTALSQCIPGLPPCPRPPSLTGSAGGDVEEIVKARNALLEWLISVLLYPGARESPAVRHFLCYGANSVPPQFDGIAWVSFSPVPGSNVPQQVSAGQATGGGAGHNLDEMDMDVMFGLDEEHEEKDGLGDHIDDDEDDYSASVRYQPTEEAITQEDVMEIQQQAGEVEMIEDVGSLAQSLGASHLGRSLKLQAEINQHTMGKPQDQRQPLTGVTVGGARTAEVGHGIVGGIGGAVQRADSQSKIQGLGDSFHQKSPISAPRLDSFKMIKVIGKGSFGKVFLVRENQTGEMFALKVLRKDNIIKRNQVEHTRTERSVLGYVKHPFIVGLNMAFQSKDKLYFVLDYCAGGELFFHLGKVGKFPEPRACFYAAEIVLAISYVHELDIIYRDLKPENVLLDARGHVRLTDFGLSKEGISSSSSGANSFCGTPEYLAPEILNRQGHGRAVDWWSLGALLYEMLTGLPPFYCRDREKLFEKIRRGHLDYPRYLSPRSQALLRGLLTKDPNLRLGSGPNDSETIKSHDFFSEILWEKLAKGEVQPPWDPQINGSLDTSQFDKEFTSMPIFSPGSLQPQPGFGTTPAQDMFEGFTFTDSQFYGHGHTS